MRDNWEWGGWEGAGGGGAKRGRGRELYGDS